MNFRAFGRLRFSGFGLPWSQFPEKSFLPSPSCFSRFFGQSTVESKHPDGQITRSLGNQSLPSRFGAKVSSMRSVRRNGRSHSVKAALTGFVISVALVSLGFLAASPSSSYASGSGWQVSLMFSGKKTGQVVVAMGSPGSTAFPNATLANTGAQSRTAIGQGAGLYQAFFQQNKITKVAFVDGSSQSLDPTQHTNYLIYDLVESSGEESLYQILRRLDEYQRTAARFHGNDSVWGSPSVLNHTAGINGRSGSLVASGGS